MRRDAAQALLVVALALSACGYALSQRYVARGGATRVHVRPFENRSAEPELGAIVTAALRDELSRRGADREEGGAEIDGDVAADEPTLTSRAAATWRVGVTVRARLVSGGAPVAEHVARREADYVGGGDPLETEARRALALRRAGADAAREVLRAFEGG